MTNKKFNSVAEAMEDTNTRIKAEVEQKDAGKNRTLADKVERIMKELDQLDDKISDLYGQIESAVWNEFDPATMDSQDPRQSLMAAWKIGGVPSLEQTLSDWKNVF